MGSLYEPVYNPRNGFFPRSLPLASGGNGLLLGQARPRTQLGAHGVQRLQSQIQVMGADRGLLPLIRTAPYPAYRRGLLSVG